MGSCSGAAVVGYLGRELYTLIQIQIDVGQTVGLFLAKESAFLSNTTMLSTSRAIFLLAMAMRATFW